MDSNTNKKLLVGWATRDITPGKPVLLWGQLYERVSESVRDPLTVTALALEKVDENGNSCDYAVMISCDLVGVEKTVMDGVREKLKSRMENFDVNRIFAFATHTHTGFYYAKSEDTVGLNVTYSNSQKKDIMTPQECYYFLVDRITEAVEEAWSKRAPGGVNRAMEHATVGYCRMAMYRDGSSRMYG
ncbi:MAG TPA: hypothetical protein GXX20_11520, partial [Clostridiaceae bacterium]|nr:hypothetical protein [Clostridiaceae bacterium]